LKRCIMLACPFTATHGALCASCHTWAYITLADVRYRSERPPTRPQQLALL